MLNNPTSLRKVKFMKFYAHCVNQLACLCGQTKAHTKDTPVHPVMSIPGSAYYMVAVKVAKWLAIVPECNIALTTKKCDT